MQTHLKGFGLENFRVFKDYTWFDFAPITILTGPNSSGKSSLNKALMLMKDNFKKEKKNIIRKNVSYPITDPFKFNYDGADHNLSSATNSINTNSKNPYISFYLKNEVFPIETPILLKFSDLVVEKAKSLFEDDGLLSLMKAAGIFEVLNQEKKVIIRITNNLSPSLFCNLPLLLELCEECLIKLDKVNEQNLELPKSYRYQKDFASELNIETKAILENFIVNFSNSKWRKSEIIFTEFFLENGPFTIEGIFHDEEVDEVIYYDREIEQQQFLDELYGNLKSQFGYLLFENDFYSFDGNKDLYNPFSEHINALTTSFINTLRIFLNTYDAREKKNKTVEMHLPNFNDLYYLPSIKGSNERSYRTKDENILNVLFKEYINKYEIDKIIEESEPRSIFYSKWFEKFGMETLSMERNDRLDANSYTVKGLSHVDIGYGMTQIIAIILRILSIAELGLLNSLRYSHIIILEEPESNLHPKFQSLLADLFLEAAETFNIQFIIETHSEYLIRKLQFLTAKKQIKPEESVIYYFHDPNNIPKGEKQVKKIEILEDGSLSDDFGPGFFDEAANWELELIRLKNSKNRKN